MEFILASASPRRRELLGLIGIRPRVVFPNVTEERDEGESLRRFLKRITAEKARSIYSPDLMNSVIISADTIVMLGDRIMGKPVDRDHAREMLNLLSGQMHEVWTGISILHRGKTGFDCQRTRVYFDAIDRRELEHYLNHEHYLDKAGAYAIQGRAAAFVRKINGCYFNVMGLPLNLLIKMLKKAGIQDPQDSPGNPVNV